MRKFRTKAIILLFALSLINTACFETEKSESDNNALIMAIVQANNFEIKGSWNLGFYTGGTDGGSAGSSVVTQTSWKEPGSQQLTILEIDIANKRFYYQFSADDAFNPSKYGRMDWATPHTNDCPGGASICFEFCQAVYAENTLADVKSNSIVSDHSNYKTNGCGAASFGWNYAVPQ
ncbi:hypothetical protein [Leptospira neocaledonica]|uniref:Lipoprotein n=1 Tax=Leptospira neocaledonica TaxID=2023192 RepID=A0A2N0A217_9LEPT|nr:hypothetical protein [Leptospira neocaledonica]PJZ78241.1 hypothetical protein CH365_02720 [Leptospira neocaledonica]